MVCLFLTVAYRLYRYPCGYRLLTVGVVVGEARQKVSLGRWGGGQLLGIGSLFDGVKKNEIRDS